MISTGREIPGDETCAVGISFEALRLNCTSTPNTGTRTPCVAVQTMTFRRSNDVSNSDDEPSHSEEDRLLEPTDPTRAAFTYLPALLLFLSELAELLLVSPRIRLLEASICRRHYTAHDPAALNPDGSVDETLCKIAGVQERMAYIRGWQVFWEAIPGTPGREPSCRAGFNNPI